MQQYLLSTGILTILERISSQLATSAMRHWGGGLQHIFFLGGDTIHFNQEPLGFFRKQVAWQQGVREMAPYPDTNSLPSLYLSTSVSPPFFLLTGKGSGLFPTTQSATCTLKMNDREWGW
jgi:hypothetical protein